MAQFLFIEDYDQLFPLMIQIFLLLNVIKRLWSIIFFNESGHTINAQTEMMNTRYVLDFPCFESFNPTASPF